MSAQGASIYFFAAAFFAFAGAAALGAAAGAAAAGTTFNALRWSRSVWISEAILFLRSVSLAMLVLNFAMALAVLETGAFFATGLAFTAFAGAAALEAVFGVALALEVVAALGAVFFAVAIFFIPF